MKTAVAEYDETDWHKMPIWAVLTFDRLANGLDWRKYMVSFYNHKDECVTMRMVGTGRDSFYDGWSVLRDWS